MAPITVFILWWCFAISRSPVLPSIYIRYEALSLFCQSACLLIVIERQADWQNNDSYSYYTGLILLTLSNWWAVLAIYITAELKFHQKLSNSTSTRWKFQRTVKILEFQIYVNFQFKFHYKQPVLEITILQSNCGFTIERNRLHVQNKLWNLWPRLRDCWSFGRGAMQSEWRQIAAIARYCTGP